MHGDVTSHDAMGAPSQGSNPTTTSGGMPPRTNKCKRDKLENDSTRIDAVPAGRGSRGATCF